MNSFLFVCSLNKLRSPTAEHVARKLGYLADSAGIEPSSVRPLTGEAIDRAEIIVCMQQRHVQHVLKLRPERASDIRVWAIPDRYEYGQPALIRRLKKHLLTFTPAQAPPATLV
jgi:predicted protein tyrosine phosphatase